MGGISPEDIDSIVEIFQDSAWDRIDVRIGETHIHLSKSAGVAHVSIRNSEDLGGPHVGDSDNSGDLAATRACEREARNDSVEIRAPHVSTFCRKENTDSAAYVDLGSSVNATSVVCRLQVLADSKVLNAGVEGTISEILAEDGALVEGGQVLFRVRASA